MKITGLEQFEGEYITTDEDESGEYIRYSKDNWVWVICESTETIHYCEELEAAYQEFIKGRVMSSDEIVKRKIQRDGFCRGCGFTIDKGTEIIYTYSSANRGQNIIFCLPCAKHIGGLANKERLNLRDNTSFIKNTFGINVTDFSKILGISKTTAYKYLDGDVPDSSIETIDRLYSLAKLWESKVGNLKLGMEFKRSYEGRRLYELLVSGEYDLSEAQIEKIAKVVNFRNERTEKYDNVPDYKAGEGFTVGYWDTAAYSTLDHAGSFEINPEDNIRIGTVDFMYYKDRLTGKRVSVGLPIQNKKRTEE
tara:strand:+ start:873 stop:1796 length:924 start_codon:yes stop_codon:yes gene_type:complete